MCFCGTSSINALIFNRKQVLLNGQVCHLCVKSLKNAQITPAVLKPTGSSSDRCGISAGLHRNSPLTVSLWPAWEGAALTRCCSKANPPCPERASTARQRPRPALGSHCSWQSSQHLPQQRPKQRSARHGLGSAKDTGVPFPDAPLCLSALFQLYRDLPRQDRQHTPWVGAKRDRIVSETSIVTEDLLGAVISGCGIGEGVSRGSCFSEEGK